NQIQYPDGYEISAAVFLPKIHKSISLGIFCYLSQSKYIESHIKIFLLVVFSQKNIKKYEHLLLFPQTMLRIL
ncbi:hypothetical protein, partial [Anabaena sp. UHCC 0451]|uniref:hypothetical protein n=1 Tax=Anabaena sp. UHCC 0451 TaxID=2055235 RepID=UPI002B1EF959